MSTFLESALSEKNHLQPTEQISEFFSVQKNSYRFDVKQIPFDQLDLWSFHPATRDLSHRSGKFFQIHGLWCKTNAFRPREWTQPILNQPEIGILGVITKVIEGSRYFLMQAKMEPGNIGPLQLSPTVQATRSNYTQVHQGALPKYLEYFRDLSRHKVLVDQLQSELGTRFVRKRNRNIVLEVAGEIPVYEDFMWLTMGQIKRLARISNFVNMNAKSVIASSMILLEDLPIKEKIENCFGRNLLDSMFSKTGGRHSTEEIVSWLTDLKSKYDVETRYLPLKDIGWVESETELYHREKKHFSIIAVSVEAGSREVSRWTQPLIKSLRVGTVGLLVKKINGVLHFLVQAISEPGVLDGFELGPTVSAHEAEAVPFIELFSGASIKIRHSSLQSNEGGRFFQNQSRYMVVDIDAGKELSLPENYKWMTLGQILEFIRYTSSVHIELRELLACLDFADSSAV